MALWWSHVYLSPSFHPHPQPLDLRDQLQSSLGDTLTLERELGGGGMSRVFLASENALGRRVVVKVVAPELAGGVSMDRFKREIALAARLQHPHIVPLLTAGDAGGIPFFTMPYVEGQSLRARLARDGELPIAEGLRILREIATALAYAHECGVVHRDIKPDNVLLSRGSAMVTDFGVAKALSVSTNSEEAGGVTSLGVALGTPAYMSPEQAAASPNVDARADIYAWGVLAYELFAGRSPFAGRTPQAMLAAHVTEAPESIAKLRPNLPSGLAGVIMRSLEKHAADRPQNASELIHVLDSITTPSGGSSPTSAQAPTEARMAMPISRRPAIVAAVFALIVLGVGVVWFARRGSQRATTARAAATPAVATKSIAVLPFVNASADPKDEYFSDGLADELTSALAIPGLRVMSRSSAFALKGKGLTGKQAGESLHVTSVLEGRVRKAGDRARITVQLVNVADGMTLWTRTYDRQLNDVLAVQEDIARSIANELKVAYDPGTSRLENGGTKDPLAHDLYLRGIFEANQRTRATMIRSIDYLKRAIARDSDYALAYVGLADSYLLSTEYASLPRQETHRLAEAAAERALRIDSTLAEPHATLMHLSSDRMQWDKADAHFRKAIALRPDYARAYHWHVNGTLRPKGLLDSAEVIIRKATELDPTLPALLINHGLNLVGLNRVDEAIAYYDSLARRFPDNWGVYTFKGHAYAVQGKYAEAAAAFKLGDAVRGNATGLRLASVYGLMGRRAEADSIIRRAEALARREYVSSVDFAMAYTGVGNKDRAFAMLNRAVDTDDHANFSYEPLLRPLHDDPRFAAVFLYATMDAFLGRTVPRTEGR